MHRRCARIQACPPSRVNHPVHLSRRDGAGMLSSAHGLDMLNVAYHYMDLVPKGRDEGPINWLGGSGAATSIPTDVARPDACGGARDLKGARLRILPRLPAVLVPRSAARARAHRPAPTRG